eukprot:758537-Hanusia_phi.AAC.2
MLPSWEPTGGMKFTSLPCPLFVSHSCCPLAAAGVRQPRRRMGEGLHGLITHEQSSFTEKTSSSSDPTPCSSVSRPPLPCPPAPSIGGAELAGTACRHADAVNAAGLMSDGRSSRRRPGPGSEEQARIPPGRSCYLPWICCSCRLCWRFFSPPSRLCHAPPPLPLPGHPSIPPLPVVSVSVEKSAAPALVADPPSLHLVPMVRGKVKAPLGDYRAHVAPGALKSLRVLQSDVFRCRLLVQP